VKPAAKAAGAPVETLALAAAGLEAEFALIVDGQPVRPEDVFGDPRGFIRAPLMHRVGTSYHLPNGTAIYFDTGVVEIATPAMELARGCMARAGRSLWESIALVRAELDEWERRTGRVARLAGFSAHYNTSLAPAEWRRLPHARLDRLARALTYVLAPPVMLLATNRRSTGVGVRPRRHRIEVTADFTPDPALMIAAGSLILGIVREVMTWRSWSVPSLGREIPVVQGFTPMPHTSRRGWLARWDCYPCNPFTADVDAAVWSTTQGPLALRAIAHRIFVRFRRSIARVSDPFSLRLIASILGRNGPSLLTLPDRPEAYDDVGRLSVWSGRPRSGALTRSRYERALMNAVAGRPLRLFGSWCIPVQVRGWSVVVFRRQADGARIALPIDTLVPRLDEWERGDSRL
jgi:hypothetical protein